MIERHRMWVTLQRARETFGQGAAERWQIGDEELSRLYRQAEALSLDTRREWRRARFCTAVVTVLVALLVGLVASLGISCVRPAPDGYAMNREADRAVSIVLIDSLVYNA